MLLDKNCAAYWLVADRMPANAILDYWCHQDSRCRLAKQQALLSACERGEIAYMRSDGKDWEDPVRDLDRRGLLLIDRQSFEQWVIQVEGSTPLPDREPSPKAKSSYLRTIAGLSAALIDGRTGKPHVDAESVAQACAAAGIELPIGPKQLAEYLKQADKYTQ